jgi:hypothetical protein
MHLGFNPASYFNHSDLVLVMGVRAPWYPPPAEPVHATVVALGENPIKGQMVHQNLLADAYVEGIFHLEPHFRWRDQRQVRAAGLSPT